MEECPNHRIKLSLKYSNQGSQYWECPRCSYAVKCGLWPSKDNMLYRGHGVVSGLELAAHIVKNWPWNRSKQLLIKELQLEADREQRHYLAIYGEDRR